jgi:hypothetical protein
VKILDARSQFNSIKKSQLALVLALISCTAPTIFAASSRDYEAYGKAIGKQHVDVVARDQ